MLAEKRSLVVPEFCVIAQQGMILDNFSDYLVEATKGELIQKVHLMLYNLDMDIYMGRICRIAVHPEFIELFRMGLKGEQWQERS